jgi:hypothetical protein
MPSIQDYQDILDKLRKTAPDQNSTDKDDSLEAIKKDVATEEEPTKATVKTEGVPETKKIIEAKDEHPESDVSTPMVVPPNQPPGNIVPEHIPTPATIPNDNTNMGSVFGSAPPPPAASVPGATPPLNLEDVLNVKTPVSPTPTETPPAPMTGTPATPPSQAQSLLEAYKAQQPNGLKEAQDKASQNEMWARILQGANQAASGISAMGSHGIVAPAKVDNTGFESLMKTAQSPVSDYEKQVANQKNDPNSRYSQIMRDFLAPKLKAAGIDTESDDYKKTAGSDLESVAKYAEADSAAKAKQDYLKVVIRNNRH